MNKFNFRDFLSHVIIFAALLGVLFGAFDFIVSAIKKDVGSQEVFHQADFDLSTVIYLMKSGQVESVAALESKINDYSSGINNIDIDGDKGCGVANVTSLRRRCELAGMRMSVVAAAMSRLPRAVA